MATVHVIGAGISGLSAATALAERGVPVKLYEAATSAGGRARSSTDRALGSIDHGLHFFSGASKELQRFIGRIGAREEFARIPRIGWADGRTGTRSHSLPAMPLADMATLAMRLVRATAEMKASDLASDHSPLQDQWITPLSRLSLTSQPHRLSVRAVRRYVRQQWGRGMARFFMARHSLNDGLITPALHYLEYHGGSVYFGQALKSLQADSTGVQSLTFARKKFMLLPEDVLIVALPHGAAKTMLPELAVPESNHCAITLHFTLEHRELLDSVLVLSDAPADLLRYSENKVSAMIRLADHAWNGDEAMLAARVWKLLQKLHPYLRGQAMPAYASWREKRAGHVLQDSPLPAPMLPPRCLLAGDWLDATQPGTLEAAAASGHRAAEATFALLGKYPEPSQYDFYLN